MTIIRPVAVVVVVLALAAALLVVRSGFVAAYGETNPARAAAVWPGHPLVELKHGLDQIGMASAKGQGATPGEVDRLQRAAWAAPLRPEPFLVRGVDAGLAGNPALARRAFAAAIRRDPRSVPAHFFMADQLLRAGDSAGGLREITTLSRLVPSTQGDVAMMLAAYAQTPGAAPQVKAMLRDHPEFEPSILTTLARDPRNAELVLYLSNGAVGDRAAIAGWQGTLVGSLVAAGDYARAHRLWSRLAKTDGSRSLLFNPTFADSTAPAPFNWTLVSSATGLAEPENKGLHLLYYGREDVVFASQLLRLDPGRYTLSFRIAVGEGDAGPLAWTLTCLPGKQSIMTIDLGTAAKANGAAQVFEVPAGCQAQQLELKGTAPEFPESVDVTLTGLAVARGAGR